MPEPNPIFEPVVTQLSNQSDKETNHTLLNNEYLKYSAPQLAYLRNQMVSELIRQMLEYKEKAEYLYLHYYNEDEGWW